MDQKFLMTNATSLLRRDGQRFEPTELTERLFETLVRLSMKSALDFYANFFGRAAPNLDATLLSRYLEARAEGLQLGLFTSGGVSDNDHLSFWCLGQVLQPQHYVESGVFIGSSLHAFLRGAPEAKIVAIDPNLRQLRIPRDRLTGARLVQDQDFSQIDLAVPANEIGLVYFDDHIDTAERIFQATQKGLRYLVVDDSTGFQGVCQRLFPAVPTIPMILHTEAFSAGDQLSWSFRRGDGSVLRVTLHFDVAMLDKCARAKRHILRCAKLPDLGETLPQVEPTATIDTTKYLLELQPVT